MYSVVIVLKKLREEKLVIHFSGRHYVSASDKVLICHLRVQRYKYIVSVKVFINNRNNNESNLIRYDVEYKTINVEYTNFTTRRLEKSGKRRSTFTSNVLKEAMKHLCHLSYVYLG